MLNLIKTIPFLFLLFVTNKTFGQKTILWSVKSVETDHTSFLLGTYHQIGNSFVDSLPKIKASLLSSDIAVFESIDIGEKLARFLNARNEDYSYQTYLKTSDLAFLKQLSTDWKVPVNKLTSAELLMKLQQVYFETQCGAVKPTDKWNHLDSYLQHLAQVNKIKSVGLETDSVMTADINAVQFSDWNSMKKPIHQWINNIKNGKRKKEYCKNVVDYMNFSFDYQFDQECGNNALLKARNERWLEEILKLVHNNNCFIAVGLLHLYGKCGLIMQLKKLGYTVEPVLNL